MRLLPLPTLLARLEHRLQVLTGGAQDVPARHQTLRGAITWSHDLLDAGEQQLFRRLAVFASGCTLEAAELVCNVGGDLALDLLDGLASLVDKSLLRQSERADGEPCFVMLDTIREYGRERLEANGEAAAIERAHAAYYLALAEEAEQALLGPRQAAWLARLDEEHENLRAALGWARAHGQAAVALRLTGALGRYWEMRGQYEAGRRWLEMALTTSSVAPVDLRAKALDAAGLLARRQGDYRHAQRLHEESLALHQALEDSPGIAGSCSSKNHARRVDIRAHGLEFRMCDSARSLKTRDVCPKWWPMRRLGS